MIPVKPSLASPIKWVGGKSKLRGKLIPLLPDDAECYVEVFAGAGWVLFRKPAHPVEVLNDKDNDLVNLYRVLKWRPAELLEAIQENLYSRTLFCELRESTHQDEIKPGASYLSDDSDGVWQRYFQKPKCLLWLQE